MRTLSTCSIFDISLRICCCTFATLRVRAHYAQRRDSFRMRPLSCCVRYAKGRGE